MLHAQRRTVFREERVSQQSKAVRVLAAEVQSPPRPLLTSSPLDRRREMIQLRRSDAYAGPVIAWLRPRRRR